MGGERPDKERIAALLDQIATLLEAQEANLFRIRSYRDGANAVRQTKEPVVEWAAREDVKALKSLPDVGEGLARIIVEYVNTGRSTLLEELQGRVSPAQLFQQVPGIGPELAQRIHEELGIESLEALEEAAHDGRLASLEGFGERRLENVRAGLAGMLSRSAQRRRREGAAGKKDKPEQPSVALLLEVDEMYRQRANAGKLKRIVPKRFNPEGKAWLPIMDVERDGWKFTVLYSNTARAHELGKTNDWVVIYYEPSGGGQERQNTVVTESGGPLQGRRVVRGRAAETRRYYAGQEEREKG